MKKSSLLIAALIWSLTLAVGAAEITFVDTYADAQATAIKTARPMLVTFYSDT